MTTVWGRGKKDIDGRLSELLDDVRKQISQFGNEYMMRNWSAIRKAYGVDFLIAELTAFKAIEEPAKILSSFTKELLKKDSNHDST